MSFGHDRTVASMKSQQSWLPAKTPAWVGRGSQTPPPSCGRLGAAVGGRMSVPSGDVAPHVAGDGSIPGIY